ncbi:hypothetical protein [Aeromonas media]|nr:hypothetical protein [Aeromonas media]
MTPVSHRLQRIPRRLSPQGGGTLILRIDQIAETRYRPDKAAWK